MAFDYLIDWVYELFGRSGVGFSGPAPLTYSSIEAWSRLTGTVVSPLEVEALLILDSVMIASTDVEPDKEDPVMLEREQIPWPTKGS